jgi:hypothetical protein
MVAHFYHFAGDLSERLNALIGGKPNESLCERAARSNSLRARIFVALVDFIIPGHCASRKPNHK